MIVNEVGEIGLDGAILRESGADAPMVMLSNGCICCQAGSDLALTVDALLAAERPTDSGPLRRIILETSGLSKPGSILRQLASLADYRMRITVVATFDATRGTELRRASRKRSRNGPRLTASSSPRRIPLRTRGWRGRRADIEALNPLAEIVATANRTQAVAAAFAPLAGVLPMPALPRVTSWRGPPAHRGASCAAGRRPGYEDLAAWLDNLAGALGDRLLRLKGLVRVMQSTRPILVQSVGTAFSIPRPLGEPNSATPLFLVIIARDLDDAELDAVQPAGLFAFSSWAEPADMPRAGSLQSALVEWI